METKANNRYYLSNPVGAGTAGGGSAGSTGTPSTATKTPVASTVFRVTPTYDISSKNPIVNVLNKSNQPPQVLTTQEVSKIIENETYGRAKAEAETQEKAKIQAQSDKMKQYGKYAIWGLGGIAAIIIIKKII